MLCCGVLTLLGDAAPALALPEMVRADGVELLLQLMHPRWEEAAGRQAGRHPKVAWAPDHPRQKLKRPDRCPSHLLQAVRRVVPSARRFAWQQAVRTFKLTSPTRTGSYGFGHVHLRLSRLPLQPTLSCTPLYPPPSPQVGLCGARPFHRRRRHRRGLPLARLRAGGAHGGGHRGPG